MSRVSLIGVMGSSGTEQMTSSTSLFRSVLGELTRLQIKSSSESKAGIVFPEEVTGDLSSVSDSLLKLYLWSSKFI
jgi:hypothetical protein